MATRRLLYLAVLGLCFLFYIAYGQWLSWVILLTILGLPWLSLVISLPAMVLFHAAPAGPDRLKTGETGELWLMGNSQFPMPPFRGKLRLTRMITGESWFYQDSADLDTSHCGGIAVTLESARICDYLGLFAFPAPRQSQKILLIQPRPLPMDLENDPAHTIFTSWKPKPGGGYAENHELRPYRPGDSLNQVHWKLSAKTGALVLRESMEPQLGLILLTMNLQGTPEQIDRKMGRLLWLGNHLLEQEIRFELRVLTAEGISAFCVSSSQNLTHALDTLLCQGAAAEGDLENSDFQARWHCHIGGDPDET